MSTGPPLIPLQIPQQQEKQADNYNSRQIQLNNNNYSIITTLLLVLQWPKSYAVDGILTTGTQPMSKQQMSNNNRPFILQR